MVKFPILFRLHKNYMLLLRIIESEQTKKTPSTGREKQARKKCSEIGRNVHCIL